MANTTTTKIAHRLGRVLKSIRKEKVTKPRRNLDLKKGESPFYIGKMANVNCGNELVKNGTLMVMIPDNQWPGEEMSKVETCSIYLVSEFYLSTSEDKRRSEVMVKLKMIDAEYFKWEIGDECDISADKLLVSKMVYSCHLSPEERITHFTRIFQPSPHPRAEERSVAFAKMVKGAIYSKDGKEAKDCKAPLVVTLDGPMRNTIELLKAGIPAKNIIVMEMRPTTALYHRLMKLALRWDIHTIWTGEDQRKANKGFQTYLHNPKLLAKHGINMYEIGFLYADFCGDIPRNIRPCLVRLTGLRILGLTQGKRKCRDANLIDTVANYWAEHNKRELRTIATYDQRSVRCSFFGLV